MKTAIVLLSLMAVAIALPQKGGGPDGDAVILKDDKRNEGIDGYDFAFDTSNGISRSESGKLKNAGSEQESMEVHGTSAHTDPGSGKKVQVDFTADENGYRPKVSIS